MKRIGLIGGLGPESTIDYYREIINSFKDDQGTLSYPEMVIYSVNLSEFLNYMKAKAYDQVIAGFLEKISALRKAGADFAAITANTPHMLFRQISEKSELPLVSIVEAACNEAVRRGLKNPGLFGTGFTMSATFYQDVFSRQGIDIILPAPAEMEIINKKLFTEIELGIFRDETRQILVDIMTRMVRDHGIDSLILGCTEFPLILTENEYAGIPMLDTVKIHVGAIVSYCSGK
jgi:aspartate racemase